MPKSKLRKKHKENLAKRAKVLKATKSKDLKSFLEKAKAYADRLDQKQLELTTKQEEE